MQKKDLDSSMLITFLVGLFALMAGNPLAQAWKYLDVGTVRGKLLEHCLVDAEMEKMDRTSIGELVYYEFEYRVGFKTYLNDNMNSEGVDEEYFCKYEDDYSPRRVTIEYWKQHPEYSDVEGGAIMSPWQRFLRLAVWIAFLVLLGQYLYARYLQKGD